MSTPTAAFAWLLRHSLASYFLMAGSFTLFGVLSLNLAHYVSANADYLLSYGWSAWQEGGLVQFLELWATIFVATGAFVVFKLSETALVHRFAHGGDSPAEIMD